MGRWRRKDREQDDQSCARRRTLLFSGDRPEEIAQGDLSGARGSALVIGKLVLGMAERDAAG